MVISARTLADFQTPRFVHGQKLVTRKEKLITQCWPRKRTLRYLGTITISHLLLPFYHHFSLPLQCVFYLTCNMLTTKLSIFFIKGGKSENSHNTEILRIKKIGIFISLRFIFNHIFCFVNALLKAEQSPNYLKTNFPLHLLKIVRKKIFVVQNDKNAITETVIT